MGLVIFGNFTTEGAGKFCVLHVGWPFRGGGFQDLERAEDFDEFCKSVIEKFLKLRKHFIQFFLFTSQSGFRCNIGCSSYVFIQNVG